MLKSYGQQLALYLALGKTATPEIHELKIEKKHYKAVYSGKKTCEIRLNDRNFKVGDFLILHVQDSALETLIAEISHISDFMQKKKYVVLSLGRVKTLWNWPCKQAAKQAVAMRGLGDLLQPKKRLFDYKFCIKRGRSQQPSWYRKEFSYVSKASFRNTAAITSPIGIQVTTIGI